MKHTNNDKTGADTAPMVESSKLTLSPAKVHRIRGGKRHTRSKEAERRREFASTVRKDANKLTPSQSETAAFCDRTKGFCEVYEGTGYTDETGEVVITAYQQDKSITAKQFLRILPQRPTETVEITGYQYDRVLRRLVATSDTKILKMSDRSLLRQGDPFKPKIGRAGIKRETSRSKRIDYDRPQDVHGSFAPADNRTTLDDVLERADPPVGKRGRSSGRIL